MQGAGEFSRRCRLGFVAAAWGIREEDDPDAAALTYRIEHLFNERSDGDITKDELREEMRAIVEGIPETPGLTLPWNPVMDCSVASPLDNSVMVLLTASPGLFPMDDA